MSRLAVFGPADLRKSEQRIVINEIANVLAGDSTNDQSFILPAGRGTSFVVLKLLQNKSRPPVLVFPWGIDNAHETIRYSNLSNCILLENIGTVLTPDAWFQVTRYVVDHCDTVLAFPTGRKDLTQYALKYAQEVGKPQVVVPLFGIAEGLRASSNKGVSS